MPPSEPAQVPPSSRVPGMAIMVLGLVFLAWLLSWQGTYSVMTYRGTLQRAAGTLRGEGPHSDIAQDMIGFRALTERRDPYPILGPAFRELGLDWDVRHTSTHPPTAYLLVAPIAYLPWNLAAAAWGWLMLGLIYGSLRFSGVDARTAVGLTPLTLLWPPVATALGQLTVVWWFGLTAAFAWARDRPFWSGVGIGLAAMPKLFAGLLVILFVRKHLWRALLGCAAVGLLALLALLWLEPESIPYYLWVNRHNSVAMAMRLDNASLPSTAYRTGGWAGVACVMLFLGLVVWSNRGSLRPWNTALPSEQQWMVASYLAVALLPIAWIYSPVPLLPVLVFLLKQKSYGPRLAGLTALSLPIVGTPWGLASVLPLVSTTVATGLGLILAGAGLRGPDRPDSRSST